MKRSENVAAVACVIDRTETSSMQGGVLSIADAANGFTKNSPVAASRA
ncbi:hypothetical protein [Agrobacterium sp. NPDC089420]